MPFGKEPVKPLFGQIKEIRQFGAAANNTKSL
jgi:hypothetical protein